MSTAQTPGVAVAILQDSDIVLRRGYGIANLEYDIPITPETVFLVASLSKQFTAFAIALLATKGTLSLQDPVRKYVPELPDYGRSSRYGTSSTTRAACAMSWTAGHGRLPHG